MGQDSKIFYNYLYRNNNNKFKSLKDVYLEDTLNTEVPIPSRAQVTPPVEIKSKIQLGTSIIEGSWSSYDVPSHLFEKDANTKQGNGEYSVASLLTGLQTREEIRQYKNKNGNPIIGDTKDVDVTVPQGQFEVKEIPGNKSVKTGTHNTVVYTRIRKAVENFLEPLQDIYNSMDDMHKNAINKKILALAEDNISSIESKRVKKEQLGHFNEMKEGWTLQKYFDSILNNLNELPKGILKNDNIGLGRYKSDRPGIIFSFKKLVDILDIIIHKNVTLSDKPGELNDAIKDISNILFKYYGATNSDVEKRYFEKQAEKIDIDVTRQQCKDFNKCTNEDFFKKSLKHLNLPARYRGIMDALEDAMALETIFPYDGVFIVTKSDFKFVPKSKLTEELFIDTISANSVKIGRKKSIEKNISFSKPNENV